MKSMVRVLVSAMAARLGSATTNELTFFTSGYSGAESTANFYLCSAGECHTLSGTRKNSRETSFFFDGDIDNGVGDVFSVCACSTDGWRTEIRDFKIGGTSAGHVSSDGDAETWHTYSLDQQQVIGGISAHACVDFEFSAPSLFKYKGESSTNSEIDCPALLWKVTTLTSGWAGSNSEDSFQLCTIAGCATLNAGNIDLSQTNVFSFQMRPNVEEFSICACDTDGWRMKITKLEIEGAEFSQLSTEDDGSVWHSYSTDTTQTIGNIDAEICHTFDIDWSTGKIDQTGTTPVIGPIC